MPQITVTLTDTQYKLAMLARTICRYRSWPELFLGWLRYWAMTLQDHALTGRWASMPARERDKIDTALLEQAERGEIKKGSWLKAEIREAVNEWILENKSYPRTQGIAEILAKRLIQLASEKPEVGEKKADDGPTIS
jgi:hypothetical protein